MVRGMNTMCKHSVVLDGHRTSVSLENAFWDELTHIAKAQNVSVNQLVTRVDHARQVDQTLSSNLSSALRVFVLNALKAPSSDAG